MNTVKEGAKRVEELEDQETCCKSVPSSNIRNYTHKISSTYLSKCEPNKDNANEHAKLDREKSVRHLPYTKNYRQLRKAGSQKGDLPPKRANQLVLQCRMVSPEAL